MTLGLLNSTLSGNSFCLQPGTDVFGVRDRDGGSREPEPPLSFRGAAGEFGTHNHDAAERAATSVAPGLKRQRLWVLGSAARPRKDSGGQGARSPSRRLHPRRPRAEEARGGLSTHAGVSGAHGRRPPPSRHPPRAGRGLKGVVPGRARLSRRGRVPGRAAARSATRSAANPTSSARTPRAVLAVAVVAALLATLALPALSR